MAVLHFFAEHPGQSFAFSDIARALRLSRATCHALLAGLVAEQYLYRTIDKRYVLGPTLAALGDQLSGLEAAHQAVPPAALSRSG